MPSITDTNLEHLSAFIGEGNVYLGATNPADGALLALTAGAPADGTWVGLTSDEAELEVEQSIEGVEVEQTTGKMAPRVKEESAKLKLTLAEAHYLSLKRAMAVASSGTDAGAGVNWVKIGGKTRVATTTVTLVSPIELEDGSTVYEWVHIYAAVPSGTKLKYKRGETRMYEVTFEAYHDATRSRGDQLLQYCVDDAVTAS